MNEIVEVELPDGDVILAEVAFMDSDIGALDRFKLAEARAAVAKIATWALNTVRDGLPESPDKIGIDIGLRLAVREGVLTTILARASAEASVTMRLEWDRKKSDG
jgi:hypothetical protein